MRTPTGPGRPGRPFEAPAAHEPDALLPLVAEALSAGDVEAALGLYAPDAVLLPWHLPPAGGGRLRDLLVSLAELKVPVHAQVAVTVTADGLALVTGSWSLEGPAVQLPSTGRPLWPSADRVALSADVQAIARREHGPAPVWRLVLERWTVRDPA